MANAASALLAANQLNAAAAARAGAVAAAPTNLLGQRILGIVRSLANSTLANLVCNQLPVTVIGSGIQLQVQKRT